LSDKSKSQHQKYRLTLKGIALRDSLLFRPTSEKQTTGEVTEQATTHDTGHDTVHDDAEIYIKITELAHRLVMVVQHEMGMVQLMNILQVKNISHFVKNYLDPALTVRKNEKTLSGKSKSQYQKYRLTSKGIALRDRILFRPTSEKQATGEVTEQATTHDAGHDTIHDTIHDDAEIYIKITELAHRLIMVVQHEMSRVQLMNVLELKNRSHFVKNYLNPALTEGLIEKTLSDKSQSKNQKYRLTKKGLTFKLKLSNRK
jgi:hypothetical protein